MSKYYINNELINNDAKNSISLQNNKTFKRNNEANNILNHDNLDEESKRQETNREDGSKHAKKDTSINISDRISNINQSPKAVNDSLNSNLFSNSPIVNYAEIITSNKVMISNYIDTCYCAAKL